MYKASKGRLRQGDIALCEFHQLRARSGEPTGPGGASTPSEDLPDLGASQTFEIPVEIPGQDESTMRQLRVWVGYVMVVHQSCELEYADPNDSRVSVAPLVTVDRWTSGPWKYIREGSLPGYFYLPAVEADEATQLGLPGPWPESAVALASTTLVSRGMVKPNRLLSLAPSALPDLQSAIVRYWTVRGWGSVEAAEQLKGKSVIAIEETTEMIPGPARLTKVFLDDPDGGDEITVVCGLRPSRKAA
jgi:hypothetical protein